MPSGSQRSTELDISYVLPTFNRVEYLGECLLTLVEQNYSPDKFEVIVVDDGSTDSTPDLMSYFTAKHKNIHFFKVRHGGVEKARNFGNGKASAPIIGVCDSDDLYAPDRTKITVEFFKANPSIDIMNGSYVEVNHRGLPVNEYRAIPLDKKAFLAGKQAYFCHDNCAYKTYKILKTPYRKEGGQTDDWKLVHDWIEAKYKFGYVEQELCKVRTLNIGIMGSRRKNMGIDLSYAR